MTRPAGMTRMFRVFVIFAVQCGNNCGTVLFFPRYVPSYPDERRNRRHVS